SRDSAQPGRPKHVGQYRLRLRQLQRPQGRPDATGSAPEPHPQAREAEAQPALESQADTPEIPVLAHLPGERLLVGGIEVAKALRRSGFAAPRSRSSQALAGGTSTHQITVLNPLHKPEAPAKGLRLHIRLVL